MGKVFYLKKPIVLKLRYNHIQCQPNNYIFGTDDSFVNELKSLFDKFNIKNISARPTEDDGQLAFNIGYIGDETFSIDGTIIK